MEECAKLDNRSLVASFETDRHSDQRLASAYLLLDVSPERERPIIDSVQAGPAPVDRLQEAAP